MAIKSERSDPLKGTGFSGGGDINSKNPLKSIDLSYDIHYN